MRADAELFINTITQYDRESLLSLAISQYDELCKLRIYQNENERIYTEAHIQYAELHSKYTTLSEKFEELTHLLAKEIEKNTLKIKSIFGRKTEQFLPLVDAADNRIMEPEDESDVEHDGHDESDREHRERIIEFADQKNNGVEKEKPGTAPKTRNRLAASMEKLPQQILYDLDIEALNHECGCFNWRIAFWHSHTTLEKIPASYYTKTVYTPVISSGLEHIFTTVPYRSPLIERSVVSPSVIADILYRKFVLGLPFYRQAKDYQMCGIDLIKQTIINWVNTLVPDVLGPVCDYLTECLVKYKYTQNDETYIQVNKNGRSAGSKNYIWVHCSSELLDCDPIIIFCYEPTRGTDHLRRFFGEFLGYITCDAYISYQVLANETDGIEVTGCFMHCRRYFAEAFFVNDVASLSDEQLREMPETKALMLIRDIYHEENKLKDMSAEDRTNARKTSVKPRVDVFFEFVHGLENSNETTSERLKKAIRYAINQETYLRRFLSDGNIPCDNGHAERIIRSYSIGRANWLFADTEFGAEVNALVYSVVETAKANKVNVGFYLQYLFEEMPKYLDQSDRGFLKDMTPWSDAYIRYEESAKQENMLKYKQLFPEPEKPRTPRKKDVHEQTASSHLSESERQPA